ncbi:hypothetical protein QYE76_025722 [Lolium multiflorum]|uniref:Uncharacterized protein n=1 Tax=Lolium multiflorum TaxID=4521 RepID=A0AAD8REY5_LOLMU|nr:hypothetical protein QYE76_025722 [Lolium multiflorum]
MGRGPPWPASPLYKEGVAGHPIPPIASSSGRLSLHHTLPGLGEALQFSSSTTTTTPSCCWTLEEIYHTSAARWNGRGRSFIDTVRATEYGNHGAPSINFNQFLEKEKLKGNGSNFTDWSRHCAILCSLEAELQKRFEHHDPCEMMRELKLIFETHAAVESYEASKQFFNCMMEEGSSVSEHMFAMSGHAKKLSDLGIVIPNKLEIKKENQVLMVNKTTSFKKQGKPNKGNFKKGGKKVAAPPEKPKAGPKPETVCYYCQGKGKRLPQILGRSEERPCQEERSEGKIFVAKNGSFLEKEFLTKEVTGRKVELDEVDEPSLIDQSSAVPEEVPVQPTPIGEEANDDDHETSNENLADRRGNVPLLIGMIPV